MGTDYGKRIEQAILAVHQMHEDTVKLIRTIDKTVGRAPILEKITDAGKFKIDGPVWMVEGMYRHYPIKDKPDVAEGLNVAFSNHPRLQEPLLIAGRVEYEFSDGASLEQTLRENEHCWDFWYAFLRWQGRRTFNEVIELTKPQPYIHWIRVVAVPFYGIQSAQSVLDLLMRVS